MSLLRKLAACSGLLPAPDMEGLLQGKQDQTPDDAARAQLAAIKKMIADGAAAKEAARLEGVEQQRLADEEFKRSTAERVQLYLAGGRNAAGQASANAAQVLPEAPPHCARDMAAMK